MMILRKTLWVAVGLFALIALTAIPAAADQVILDDLIVDGSICVGQDCVNGESFGFDTIRIKENNLRIKAQDTSSTASFPTQDWQLTFNDSSNGGANKFAVECVSPASSTPFTVEGCAPSHSLYVDDGGRIGFGTSTPVADLHVKSGNTPTLRLEQDGSSGFTAQTWDVAGNEANFFIRDATNGSTLPIRLRPGAPSSALDIQGDGDIGIGTSAPDVLGQTRTHLSIAEAGTGAIRLGFKSLGGEDWAIVSNPGGTESPVIFASDTGTALTIRRNGDVFVAGTLDLGNTNTGGLAGTDACIDSNGAVCACGTCG